jgi:hypothetical protein
MPEELDSCGTGKVICYKDGELSCWPVEDCDTTYGGSTEECRPGTYCCEHRSTKQKGCYSSVECKPGSGGGGGGGGSGDHDSSGRTQCKKADGSVVTCLKGKTCCEKGGKRDCYPEAECDGGGAGCMTSPCQDKPESSCFESRFAATAKGCTCDELCQAEFDRYGTIQDYDGGSYRTFEQIVEEDYGLSPDTKEYWEKYGEIREEAFGQCREACGACEDVEALSLTGSETVTKPGASQFTASGGMLPYTWAVEGTGVTISEDGLVTAGDDACGSFTATVTDKCGQTATMDARITNAGSWVQVGAQTCSGSHAGPLVKTSGKHKFIYYVWPSFLMQSSSQATCQSSASNNSGWFDDFPSENLACCNEVLKGGGCGGLACSCCHCEGGTPTGNDPSQNGIICTGSTYVAAKFVVSQYTKYEWSC